MLEITPMQASGRCVWRIAISCPGARVPQRNRKDETDGQTQRGFRALVERLDNREVRLLFDKVSGEFTILVRRWTILDESPRTA